jgi:hypothetical protein
MANVILIVLIFLIVISVIIFVIGKREHHRHHHKYTYIPPCSLKGWRLVRHPRRWLKSRLINAPNYEPQQGMHYYPYCRGKHYEYLFEGSDIYSRKIVRRRH